MTRSETPRTTFSPRRLKMDKENVHSASKKSVHTPSPSKHSLRTSTGSAGSSSPSTTIPLRTPTGSSKLLRQHFQKLSMANANNNNNNGSISNNNNNNSNSGRRCRLMDSGPVRILTPRQCRIIGMDVTSPLNDHYNNTSNNTSSSCSTGSHSKILRPRGSGSNGAADEESSTDQSFGSIEINWTLPTSAATTTTPPRRMGCMDPVAFTLLKGGEEDPSWLLEQDKSIVSIPKVSANLSDVYGEYTREFARPVAVFARRQM